ncbi:aminotransferase class I/II-fold pyridoxal phosphate-dependent enzyme [Hydrogenimonas cancrithermarum]|uniref:8-amino-7-oxononanoate synthase n=1 Tax=Hydrogenimonas cancrithermarum TaxID=2993563 RepID=A0ABN6WWA6_9BACT|nr:pyridoxal phosphate-dependent aminotransferase family protein [Hydrogenimonas cancrithermarum]BDY13331.1 8-amino-7-oxononanoate synthase [Hydrogenimonas cancrithermarum]
MYERELAALRRSGRFREPITADPEACDMASNDYLGLAHKRKLLKHACNKVAHYPYHGPKSSLFVGGYHPIHAEFERALCEANGFEAGVVAGSGFLANLGLIEALVRRGDVLFIDESYHASGMAATKLVQGQVVTFSHNDSDDLVTKLAETDAKRRRIIAVEGIYSMEGDMVKREFFEIAEWFDALMIVDEAHSSGTVGPNLLGVFDYYGITPKAHHIKMGTLGKAYGSYGAYILGSEEVVSFLHNRAKPLIYATAPSLFDIALAHEGFGYIGARKEKLTHKIEKRKDIVEEALGFRPEGMIVPVPMPDIETALRIRDALRVEGYEVGAIRPPTVPSPILRVILRTSIKPKAYRRLFAHIEELMHG